MNTRRRVAVVLTGGTIESLGRDRLDMAWYSERPERLTDREVIDRVPELHDLAVIEPVPFRKVSSHALTTSDWLELARLVTEIVSTNRPDGVVVTHGTNTIEETAYFLHLTVHTTRPVVLVGAMRPRSALSTDGDLNLVNAVATAASPQAAGHGVLVVLNDTIHSARDVTKAATFRVQAFDGRDNGPLGYADNDRQVVFYHRSLRRHTSQSEFDVSELESLPRVDVVVSHVGADGALIDAAVSAGTRGIVSAGTGVGRVTPEQDQALDRARAAGVSICIGTRVGSGRVARSPGLQRRGFVAADNLVPWKARILLALALTRTDEPDEIQRIFDAY
jgi:L-asparaginase